MFWLQPLQYLKIDKILRIRTKAITIVNNRSPNFNISPYYVILRQLQRHVIHCYQSCSAVTCHCVLKG